MNKVSRTSVLRISSACPSDAAAAHMVGVVSHKYLTRCAASLEETQRAPGSVAPGAAAPPRHSARYDSSARGARRQNSLTDRASYLRDTTLEVGYCGQRKIGARQDVHQVRVRAGDSGAGIVGD